MSLEAFPADPDLPELEIASDPERMREIFRRRLRPVRRTAYQIQDCVLSRVRYREGERCILQYMLRLVNPTTGSERRQWVTGTIYDSDRAEQTWKKIRATDAGTSAPAHPRVAARFFQHQEPHWPDQVAALLEEVRDSMAGRVW